MPAVGGDPLVLASRCGLAADTPATLFSERSKTPVGSKG